MRPLSKPPPFSPPPHLQLRALLPDSNPALVVENFLYAVQEMGQDVKSRSFFKEDNRRRMTEEVVADHHTWEKEHAMHMLLSQAQSMKLAGYADSGRGRQRKLNQTPSPIW